VEEGKMRGGNGEKEEGAAGEKREFGRRRNWGRGKAGSPSRSR